jgi:hypothetical protein
MSHKRPSHIFDWVPELTARTSIGSISSCLRRGMVDTANQMVSATQADG